MTEIGVDLWLNYIRADGVVLAQARLEGDWGIQMDRAEGSYFHFLAQGSACYSVAGGPNINLQPGDLLILPQGAAHHLKGLHHSQVTPLLEFARKLKSIQSDADDASVIMCGQFGIDRHMVLPAIQALPHALHLQADAKFSTPIAQTLKQLRNELEGNRVGDKVIIRHLLSTLFIYVLREWVTLTPHESRNWFSAMHNSRISKALTGIHQSPANPWTLTTLAQEAGLSRSAFARHFREAVGETPYSYLSRWRIGVAAQLLSNTKLSVSEVAAQVGYQSEDSFARAFKAARGVTPSKAREQPNATQLDAKRLRLPGHP